MKRRDAPDLAAHKEGKWIPVEVKALGRLYSYSEATEELGGELILLINMVEQDRATRWLVTSCVRLWMGDG